MSEDAVAPAMNGDDAPAVDVEVRSRCGLHPVAGRGPFSHGNSNQHSGGFPLSHGRLRLARAVFEVPMTISRNEIAWCRALAGCMASS